MGSHEDLLPYLVRRLLENGANTSFVNRISDESISVEDIVADPITETMETECRPHERIPAPEDLFGNERRNSAGFNLPIGMSRARSWLTWTVSARLHSPP